MGFAHGYLIGKEFVDLLDQSLPIAFGSDVAQYDRVVARLLPHIRIPTAAQEEIGGIFDGIKAANGNQAPYLKSLKRQFRLDDLIFQYGAGDVYRAFACSGFTVWGERAGEEGVITTRNYDFSAYSPSMVGRQMILVRQPQGRHQVATITWPGMIGAFTGINDAGVAAFIHDGTGKQASAPSKQYTPVILVLTEMLESAGPAEAHERTRQMLQAISAPFSYMVRVVTPRVPRKVSIPERVFQVDDGGVSENSSSPEYCITTNHYLGKSLEPSAAASESSLRRYQSLERSLQGPVTRASAWQALAKVATAAAPYNLTLHSLVLSPERRRLDLSFASWSDRAVPATGNKPTTIAFEVLFGRTAEKFLRADGQAIGILPSPSGRGTKGEAYGDHNHKPLL
jgi:hypothetical protein